MPQPLDSFQRGEKHPYDRGATKVVSADVVEHDGDLRLLAVWDNGDRTPLSWSLGVDDIEDAAWWAVALDVARPEEHRRQAIARLIEIAHDSHRYDCSDG